ncbi:riboflavin synthase [Methylocystis parvus]|uniref:Riboflavin synthase n=1 Tax=Methylocystis parvus TaxID=134 RepID=A0A6B8M7W8_9HYPH|nr:riboflavin synthase [Methylocystis parvus]QGM98648.1 riboflavin synthase [Methylocystis parvus]WBK01004.1 riboflavin synthase [Methylocystis parvus OBBP]
MFTGIVTDIGEVLSVEPRGDLKRLRIVCAYDADGVALGASIAHAGVCLTVVAVAREGGRTVFDVDAAAETLAKTTVETWKPGTRVNLERALKIGDELGGHIVTGHVDGVARIVSREDICERAPDGRPSKETSMARFWIEAPRELSRFIAQKGSVALDGASLTVNEVEGDRFSILLIPHTLAVTTFGACGVGDALNIEVDMMARYAARLSEK